MPERLYQLSYEENDQRPIYIEDAGHLLMISGILLQGMGSTILLIAPNGDLFDLEKFKIVKPTLEEWCAILKRSDDPLIFEQDETGTIKAIIRKVQRTISGAVQQQIWHRDGFQCLYCGKAVPEVQVTVDHFQPLELGGQDNPENYATCCRQCNKKKGNRSPLEYCSSNNLDYEGLTIYLSGKASKLFVNHLQKGLDRF